MGNSFFVCKKNAKKRGPLQKKFGTHLFFNTQDPTNNSWNFQSGIQKWTIWPLFGLKSPHYRVDVYWDNSQSCKITYVQAFFNIDFIYFWMYRSWATDIELYRYTTSSIDTIQWKLFQKIWTIPTVSFDKVMWSYVY